VVAPAYRRRRPLPIRSEHHGHSEKAETLSCRCDRRGLKRTVSSFGMQMTSCLMVNQAYARFLSEYDSFYAQSGMSFERRPDALSMTHATNLAEPGREPPAVGKMAGGNVRASPKPVRILRQEHNKWHEIGARHRSGLTPRRWCGRRSLFGIQRKLRRRNAPAVIIETIQRRDSFSSICERIDRPPQPTSGVPAGSILDKR